MISEILLFMGVVVEYPIIVHIDNVGAIFLSEKTSEYQQTKHIDMRHHIIRDCVEGETVKIKFVCLEEKLADPFTKNLSNGPFESLTLLYVNCEQDLKNTLSLFKSQGSK